MDNIITTPYLHDFQCQDFKEQEENSICDIIEICQETGDILKAYFTTILLGKYYIEYKPGTGKKFNRPHPEGKESEYYIKEAQKARKENKSSYEIRLLISWAEIAQKRETAAERDEKKNNNRLQKIWNV